MMKRIFNIIILFLCSFKFLIRGKSNKKNNNPQKVLIIQQAKLGDMICTTPMFRAIKEKHSNCKVYVMGNKINKEVLAGNFDVDGYIIYDNNFYQNVRRVKSLHIDFACTTHPNFIGLAILYLAGIKTIVTPIIKNGFSPVETKSFKLLRRLAIIKPHNMRAYAPREYLRLLEPINIYTNKTKKYLFYSSEAEEKVKRFFQKNNINLKNDLLVGIAPSAGNKLKIWGGRKFAKLADLIYSKYKAKIIVFGINSDKFYIDEMIQNLSNQTKVINTCSQLSIDELKATISKLTVLIGPDTGLIYIAEAFKVPTIDITGPVDENEQPPIGDIHKVIFANVNCRPCSFVMNAARECKNKKEPFLCFNKIRVKEVYNEFEKIITNLKI